MIHKIKKQKIIICLTPVILIVLLILGSIHIINFFSTPSLPKITIYEELISPNNKYIAIHYNIEDGMAVKFYDQFCIRENTGTSIKKIIKQDTDSFNPYFDRIFVTDNNHTKIDMYWENDNTIVIKYDFKSSRNTIFQETSWSTNELDPYSHEISKIKIKYIDTGLNN